MTEPTPATDAGSTAPAGSGVDDAELSRQVAEQTSNDLAVEGAFEREAAGTDADTEAAEDPS
jgi:protease I